MGACCNSAINNKEGANLAYNKMVLKKKYGISQANTQDSQGSDIEEDLNCTSNCNKLATQQADVYINKLFNPYTPPLVVEEIEDDVEIIKKDDQYLAVNFNDASSFQSEMLKVSRASCFGVSQEGGSFYQNTLNAFKDDDKSVEEINAEIMVDELSNSDNEVEVNKVEPVASEVSEQQEVKKEPVPPPSDDELRNLLNAQPGIENFETCKTEFLDCSVNQLWDAFFSDDAKFPFDAFQRASVPSRNQSVEKWLMGSGTLPPVADLTHATQLDQSQIVQVRLCSADIDGFKVSHLDQIQYVVTKTPTLIKLRVHKQISKVPYSDHFVPEEEWVITSTDGDANKCVLRYSLYVNFFKKSMMKGTILKKTFGATVNLFDLWAEYAKKNIKQMNEESA